MIKLKAKTKPPLLPTETFVARLMVFELSVGGHYPEYIAHLINYWHEQPRSRQLIIVVSPKFIQQHSDVVDLAKKYSRDSGKSNLYISR